MQFYADNQLAVRIIESIPMEQAADRTKVHLHLEKLIRNTTLSQTKSKIVDTNSFNLFKCRIINIIPSFLINQFTMGRINNRSVTFYK